MSTVRLTMAQALVRYLAAQRTLLFEDDTREAPLIAGVLAIFGHGNVAGLGEALFAAKEALPTWRGQNEQSMAQLAVAYAKAKRRRQVWACTTSIGPGATNLVTAAATAHVNRLPLLLLPGDVFAGRLPDPVLQQLEDPHDGLASVNDCLRPVSRYWDRITRPEQLLSALPRAVATLTCPERCGPVTLALPQDVQTFAYDYPEAFFAPRVHHLRRPPPDPRQLEEAAAALARARRPLIIAGGGVAYSNAAEALGRLAERTGIPVCETQAGKGALVWEHPSNVGAVGVTGTAAANAMAREADVVLAVGTRLQDFTTASWTLFRAPEARLIALNVSPLDAEKHGALSLVADARAGLEALSQALAAYRVPEAWTAKAAAGKGAWEETIEAVTRAAPGLPSDAQVLGAVQRAASAEAVVVCAAGGLPGELHKLWRVRAPGGYHLEYGYSCMGYEIAGGVGVKLAAPEREVIVLVGDGSYLMMSSELVTAAARGVSLTVVVLDNRGYGCIDRLQRATGGASFNNLQEATVQVDFAAHARAMGAAAEKLSGLDELEAAVGRARGRRGPSVLVIDTDPARSTQEGGAFWEVPVPEVSERPEVRAAHAAHAAGKQAQRRGVL